MWLTNEETASGEPPPWKLTVNMVVCSPALGVSKNTDYVGYNSLTHHPPLAGGAGGCRWGAGQDQSGDITGASNHNPGGILLKSVSRKVTRCWLHTSSARTHSPSSLPVTWGMFATFCSQLVFEGAITILNYLELFSFFFFFATCIQTSQKDEQIKKT